MSSAASTNPYVELGVKSYFSLLDGASSPEALVKQAAALGMPALALTDRDAVYGAVEFQTAARDAGIKPIFGTQLTLAPGTHLTLLVENAQGWASMCALITAARMNAPKGSALLPPGVLENHTEGLFAVAGSVDSDIAAALLRDDVAAARAAALRYKRLFGRKFYIEVQRHYLPTDYLVPDLVALARELSIPIVATNAVHYAVRDGYRLQHTLTAIRHNAAMGDIRHLLLQSAEFYLKSDREMKALFPDFPDAIANAGRIADRCTFELNFGVQDLPIFPTPEDTTPKEYLRTLCRSGIERRRLDATPELEKQLDYELGVIERAGLINYFLIVWDIVRWARANDIRCQGRGSAANSLVAYLLLISAVDPLQHNLVFERFLSDERRKFPDIDIDFDALRREEVIQYIYRTYGHAHAAMVCTFVTFRSRSAIRDVGKALGLTLETINIAARESRAFKSGRFSETGELQQLISPKTFERWVDLVTQIKGLPKFVSIHNGGFFITLDPLTHRVPVEPATMDNRFVIQLDKDSVADGVKIDILGLRALTALAEAARLAGVDLDTLTFDDPKVYERLTAADTFGVTQVESAAQQNILPQVSPKTFNDIIQVISLIRPGTLVFVKMYLERRLGKVAVSYLHWRLKPVLEETYGVPLFQEQVLAIAVALAGFTGGQGELLRRALSSKNAPAAIEAFYEQFIAGALALDVERAVADETFDWLRSFGGYSFAKSHAASFAVLVYQGAWLKLYYPTEYLCALLNAQPMGYWSAAALVNDAKRHGVRVLGVDLRYSSARCVIEDGAVRLGFTYVSGIEIEQAERIVNARADQPFVSLRDFRRRVAMPYDRVENLIFAGAMQHFDTDSSRQVMSLATMLDKPGMLPLELPDEESTLPPMTPQEELVMQYEMTGIMLHDHLLTICRDQLDEVGAIMTTDLHHCRPGTAVKIAGLRLDLRQPPTAKSFGFLKLEDEEGICEMIIRPDIGRKFERTLRDYQWLVAEGIVQREKKQVKVILQSVVPLAF